MICTNDLGDRRVLICWYTSVLFSVCSAWNSTGDSKLHNIILTIYTDYSCVYSYIAVYVYMKCKNTDQRLPNILRYKTYFGKIVNFGDPRLHTIVTFFCFLYCCYLCHVVVTLCHCSTFVIVELLLMIKLKSTKSNNNNITCFTSYIQCSTSGKCVTYSN